MTYDSQAIQQDQVTVTGEGIFSAVPDMVVLTVGIESSAANAVQALGGVHSCMSRVAVGSSRVDLQACKLEYSIVSPK